MLVVSAWKSAIATSVYLSLLTKDYARRAGDVIQLRRDLRVLTKEALRADLAALLTVIRRKDPGFDPARVKPIRTTVQVAGFSHNRLTTSILECLREAAPEPASKETIAMFVADRRGLTLDGSRVEYLKLSRCIQKRLKGMAAAGTVVRE